MKAIVLDAFGGVEHLSMSRLPRPTPGPGEILIEVDHAAVNPVDWKIRKGLLRDHLPHEFPIILGWDAAGLVSALGEGVTEFEVGDRVFAYCRKPLVKMGAYAQFITVEARVAARVPEVISLAAASTVPLVGLTAWQALFEFGELKSGESCLILGGAGGVGGYAIQFARQVGARVAATASPANLAYLAELGCQHPVDYTQGGGESALKALQPGGFDLVFDCVGGTSLDLAFRAVKSGGRLVSIVQPPDTGRAAAKQLKAGYHFVYPNGEQLRSIAQLLAQRKVQILPFESLPITEVATAHDRSEERHVRGKLTLSVKGVW